MAKIEIAKPVRFTVFFLLFLTFVLLGVKACNDQKLNTEVAEIEELLEDQSDKAQSNNTSDGKTPTQPEKKGEEIQAKATNDAFDKNSQELSDFKTASPDNKSLKSKSSKQTSSIKKINSNETKPGTKKKAVKASATINVKAATTKNKTSKPKAASKPNTSTSAETKKSNSAPKMRLKVSGADYKLDSISNAKLKGAIQINKNTAKIEAVGFISAGSSASPIVKANEIKSTLLRLGVDTKVEIKTITEKGEGYGEVRFY